jgi:tyrosine-protein phosphatase YwqE
MFEFLFTKTRPRPISVAYPPFEAVEVDIHSHLIPGVDDGAPDIATALSLMRHMQHLGFRKIITTPHISELYPNSHQTILAGLAQLQRAAAEENLNLEFSLAAEYMINDMFEEKVANDEPLLTLPKRHILIEMSHLSEPVNLYSVLSLLITKGYTPILAHPERYRCYNGNMMYYEIIKSYGCRLQVNALSLVGYYGKQVADCAWSLINHRMADFIGSDIHHHRHLEAISQGISADLQHVLLNYPFQNKQLFKKTAAITA